MAKQTDASMAEDRRGLLTDREREILLSNGEDISDNYYGVVVTRVRSKIERVGDDLEALAEHDTLAAELQDIVCSESSPDSEPDPVGSSDGSTNTFEDGLTQSGTKEEVVSDE